MNRLLVLPGRLEKRDGGITPGLHCFEDLAVACGDFLAAVPDPRDIGKHVLIARKAGPQIDEYPVTILDGSGAGLRDFKVRVAAVHVGADDRGIERLQALFGESLENLLLDFQFVGPTAAGDLFADERERLILDAADFLTRDGVPRVRRLGQPDGYRGLD